MLSIQKFGILVLGLCLLFPANSAFGHGLGIDTISSVDVQGKKLSITVELPEILQDDSGQLTITATESSKDNAKNVTFLIGLFHDEEMIFRNYFFAKDGVLPIKITPTQNDKITIHGMQDSLLGAWHGVESSPVEITGPLFDSAGLYNFEIQIRTIDEPTNIIEDSEIYYAGLSIIENNSFITQDLNNNDVEFSIKSYFDKISSFEFDPEIKQITFEMPFDWSEKQMSHIPLVHEEIHFPKNLVEFISPSYQGYVNGIKLFKSSVTVDDYTVSDERIVHFVLLQEHLRYLKNEMKKSEEPLPENIVFTLSVSDESAFPLIAYTNDDEIQMNLSWEPLEVEPGVATNFVFTIRDGATGEPIRNSEYTFVIIQSGQEIYRNTGVAQIGGDFEKFTFSEDQVGPTIIKFENIRNTGAETEFGLVVVPEFGSAVFIILLVSITGVILITRKNSKCY